MGRKSQKKIIFLVFFLFLSSLSISAQTQKKVAPIRKKNLNSEISNKNVAEEDNENLDLKTIDIEKVREEKVNTGDKPADPVRKSLLITENPYASFSGLSIDPYTKKNYAILPVIEAYNSYARVYAGLYATLGLEAGLVLPEMNNFEAGIKFSSTDGYIKNAGYNNGSASVFLPLSSEKLAGLSLNGQYAENFDNESRAIIKKDGYTNGDIYHNWNLAALINQSSLFGNYYNLEDVENEYARSEVLFGIRNKTAWDYSANLKLSSNLWVALHNLDYNNENKSDVQIFFMIDGTYTLFDHAAVSIGFNIFRFNWAVTDSLNIRKKQISDLYPFVGFNYNTDIGYFRLSYQPLVEYGMTHSRLYNYANFSIAQSQFQVMPSENRFIFQFVGNAKQLKYEFSMGQENVKYLPYVAALNQISYWNFAVHTGRIFSHLNFGYYLENDFNIFAEIDFQDFMDLRNITHIPFEEKWRLSMKARKWLLDPLSIKAGLIYSSPQYIEISSNEKTEDQMNISLGADYSPIENLKFEIEVQNMLGQKIWVSPNFRLPEFYVEIGINYLF